MKGGRIVVDAKLKCHTKADYVRFVQYRKSICGDLWAGSLWIHP